MEVKLKLKREIKFLSEVLPGELFIAPKFDAALTGTIPRKVEGGYMWTLNSKEGWRKQMRFSEYPRTIIVEVIGRTNHEV